MWLDARHSCLRSSGGLLGIVCVYICVKCGVSGVCVWDEYERNGWCVCICV
jgi:hypothetical protein